MRTATSSFPVLVLVLFLLGTAACERDIAADLATEGPRGATGSSSTASSGGAAEVAEGAGGAGGDGKGGANSGGAGGEIAAPRKETAVVAGWNGEGDPVLFDTATGSVLAVAAGAGLDGGRDLVVDVWLSRLLVREGGAEGAPGEIASYPVVEGSSGLSLGPRKHEARVDGPARLVASPFGAVVLGGDLGEDLGGEPAWWLLSSSGAPSLAAYSPLPASVTTRLLPDGRLRVTALTHGASGDAADMRVALVDAGGVSAPVTVPLPVSPVSAPLSARWAEVAGGGQIIEAAGGDVLVSTFAGGGWPPWMAAGVGPGIERVEQAVSFAGGERLALLVSGAADVVILGVGAGGAPECAAALDLPGAPEPAGPSLARGLVVVGPERVLAATQGGVFLVAISGDCPPSLAVDPGFDGSGLRGPIDVLR